MRGAGSEQRGGRGVMRIFNYICFLLCALCAAFNWDAGNQDIAIWLGFLAISNLMLGVNNE